MMAEAAQDRGTHAWEPVEHILCLILLALAIVSSGETSSAPVWIDEPAAMVEQVVDGPDGLSNFDYVYPGRVIDLGTKGALSLIYFQNCMREEITGGSVTIGEHGSDVHKTVQLNRTSLDCGGLHELSDQRGRRTSAAMVFRGQSNTKVINHSAPCILISSQADWLSIVETRSELEIFLLGEPSNSVDLRDYNIFLTPGRAYRISTNKNDVVIRVSPDAGQQSGSETLVLETQQTEKVTCGNP
jgi:hypothetical protein